MNFIIQKKYVKRESNKSPVNTALVLTHNREEVDVFRIDLLSAFYALSIRHLLLYSRVFHFYSLKFCHASFLLFKSLFSMITFLHGIAL